jgi:hypothetical protein
MPCVFCWLKGNGAFSCSANNLYCLETFSQHYFSPGGLYRDLRIFTWKHSSNQFFTSLRIFHDLDKHAIQQLISHYSTKIPTPMGEDKNT